MNPADDYSFDGCRNKLRQATEVVIAKENAYEAAIERAADAEAVYRKEVAARFGEHRGNGKAVEESTTLARADVALLSRERDYAKDMVKKAASEVEDARDSRRSLWRLIEWARERDLIAARQSQQQAVPS